MVSRETHQTLQKYDIVRRTDMVIRILEYL